MSLFSCFYVVFLLIGFVLSDDDDIPTIYHEYIILGAGPGGLQMAYLMEHFDPDKKFDYIVIDENDIAGNFFNKYPRHNTLLSINKVYTGNKHHEFNLRHDWNSLITPVKPPSDKYSNNINTKQYNMRFANYSEEYYPDRHDLAKYLSDYSIYFNLNILYNAKVTHIEQDEFNDDGYILDVSVSSKPQNIYRNDDNNGDTCNADANECNVVTLYKYKCSKLFVATGLSKENIPPIPGIEHASSYGDMSLDISDYKNKRIAILGGRNSAFEIAKNLSTVSAHTHVFPILIPRFSYETHYVGDLRAINMEFLDHYLLKSLDAITEQTILEIKIIYDEANNVYYLPPKDKNALKEIQRPWPMREAYDIIIYATGFVFECKIFDEEICNRLIPNPRKVRYPAINNYYGAKKINNIYFLGGLMHSVDWKKAAGGFIHGYRYLIKALYHQIVEKSFKNTIKRMNVRDVSKNLLIRVNTASSYYQMFSVMGDIVVVRKKEDDGGDGDDKDDADNYYADYYYDVLISQLNKLNIDKNSDKCTAIITMTFDYHEDFIGHDVVLYDRERVVQDYKKAKDAKFLHPVLRYYSCKVLLNKNDNSYQDYEKSKYKISERHIIEDFLTLWDSKKYHMKWTAKWVKKITKIDQNIWDYSVDDMINAYD